MLADADVFIRSADDPLMQIEFHRHFTHSLAFIPLGGLLAAALLWVLLRRRLGLGSGRVLLYAMLGYATAGLLDACTSYGTHLGWPFSGERVAWNIISIVDPVFTGTLLLLVAVGAWKRRVKLMRCAGVFVLGYLGVGIVQNVRVGSVVRGVADARGHVGAERFVVKPALGNLILWRGMYEWEGRIFMDAVRAGMPGSVKVYAGDSVEKVEVKDLGVEEGSRLARDLERFAFFSDGWVAWHPEEEGVLGDARYSMVPDEVLPLWGIGVDLDVPGEHVEWRTFRGASMEKRGKLWEMVLGR